MRLWRRHFVGVLVALFGLAAALATTLLAVFYVYDGVRSDAWMADAARIHSLNEQWLMNGQQGIFGLGNAVVLEAGPLLRDNMDGIAGPVRLYPLQAKALLGTDSFGVRAFMADTNLTDVLRFPMLRGDMASALADPSGLVISESEADRLFTSDPIGQTLTLSFKEQRFDYTVRGVMADIPSNSQFDLTILVPWADARMKVDGNNLGTGSQAYTYFKADPGTDAAAIDARVRSDITAMVAPRGAITVQLSTAPLLGAQYYSAAYNYMKGTVSRSMARTLLIMAAVLMAAACFNFIHMFTSLNLARGREVAIRRIAGAGRGHLMAVLLLEAGLVALLAFGLGVLLATDLAGLVENLVGRRIPVLAGHRMPLFAAFAGLALAVGLLAAATMAAQVSRMQPQHLLHRSQRAVVGGGRRVKQTLVALQALALVASTAAGLQIYHQFDHYMTMERGLRVEGVLLVNQPPAMEVQAPFQNEFRQKIAALPGVIGTALVGDVPFSGSTSIINVRGHGMAEPAESIQKRVGPRYLEMMEIEPVASSTAPWDGQKNVVAIPERSLAQLGFDSPQAAIDQTVTHVYQSFGGDKGGTSDFRIVAVLPDPKDNAYNRRQPMLYDLSPPDEDYYGQLLVRTQTDDDAVQQAVRDLWRAQFPDHLESENIQWFSSAIAARYSRLTKTASAVAAMAGLCLLLCIAALYSTASFFAATQAREIALRRVLGAPGGALARLFLRRLVLPVAVGGLLALVPTWYLMHRWISRFSEQAPMPVGYYGLVLGAVLLLSALMLAGHVRRMLRMRPARVLYHE
jgi:putative ABC transport system permease protein